MNGLGGARIRLSFLTVLAGLALTYLAFQMFYYMVPSPGRRLFAEALSGWQVRVVSGEITVSEPPRVKPDQLKSRLPLQPGDILLGVVGAGGEDIRIKGNSGYIDAFRAIHPNKAWSILIQRKGGEGPGQVVRYEIPPRSPPETSALPRILLEAPGMFLVLLCIGTALFIGWAKPEDPLAFLASLLLICVGGLQFHGAHIFFPAVARDVGYILFPFLFSWVTALYLAFFLLFPTKSALARKFPWLKTFGFVFALLFSVWNTHWHYLSALSWKAFEKFHTTARWIDVPMDLIYTMLFLLGFTALIMNRRRASSADEKRRMTILLVGSLGFFPAFAYYLVAVTVGEIKIPSWASLLLWVATITFPLSFAYAVVKHRIFGIKVLMRKGLQFFLLSKGVLFFEGVVVFLALFYLAEGIFSRALKWTGPSTLAIATALVTMGSVVGMRRVNRRLMHRIERKFFREAYDARHILTELTRNVRRVAASDPEKLIRTVTSTVVDSLHPDQAAVFLRGTEISRLPLNHRGVQPLLQKTGTDNGGSYYCYWHHAYRHTPSEVEIREACGQNVFPADSFIIRRLEHELAAEEGALEIYLDNPRSWVRSQASGMTSRERALITRWNLRLLVPLSTKKGLCGFLGLGEKLSEEPYSSEDKELLLALAQQMADGLDYAELMLEGQEQAKTAHELEIAKQVQEKLFPQQAVPAAGLDYAGVCRPARVVGGDYYDFIRLDNKKIGIAIGDISGKGVSAALLMASLQATLRSQATAYGQDTAKVVCGINDHLLATTDDNRFATLFYGIFDSSSCVLDYVNCGHNPPIVLRTDPSPQILRLKASTTVLGVVPALSCPSDSIELRAGDVLVLYSDGITEAVNDHDEMFGEERLIEVVSGLDHHPAYEIRDQVIDAVLRFSGDLPPSDDITLIIGKIL